MNAQQLASFVNWCARCYIADPRCYHTPAHMRRVVNFVTTKSNELLAKRGPDCVNQSVAIAAAAGHDVFCGLPVSYLHHLNPDLREFDSQEALSCAVVAQYLHSIGVGQDEIELVIGSIMPTNPDYPIESIEGALVAAGDLCKVAGDFTFFAMDGEALHYEAEQQRGCEISPERMAKGSTIVLAQYAVRSIRLTDSYLDEMGRSKWHLGLVINLMTRIKTVWPNQPVQVVVDLSQHIDGSLGGLYTVLARPQTEGQPLLYLSESPYLENRQQRLRALTQAQSSQDRAFAVVLPQEKLVHLNDGQADQVLLHLSDVSQGISTDDHRVTEIRRLIGESGQLRVICEPSPILSHARFTVNLDHNLSSRLGLIRDDTPHQPVLGLWERRYRAA